MVIAFYTGQNGTGQKFYFNVATVQHRHYSGTTNTDTPTTQYYNYFGWDALSCIVTAGTELSTWAYDYLNGYGTVTLYTKTNIPLTITVSASTPFKYVQISTGLNTVNVGGGLDIDANWYIGEVVNSSAQGDYRFVIVRDGIANTGRTSSMFMNDGKILFRFNDEVVETPITADNEPLEGVPDYGFEGDAIDLPTAPDETVSGALASGFLNFYSPTDSQLRAFGGLLWTSAFNAKWYEIDSVINVVVNAISDPINYIVGLFMLPITPDKTTSTGIYLGGINVSSVQAYRISKQWKTIDFGSINISELYGNYLDYSNSRLSIYLPYIGTADIDIQEVNGGTISLQYIIDCFTGACVANVKCEKTTHTPWGEDYTNNTVHSYSGNVALQLPISAGSFDTLLQGLINVGLGLGTNSPAMVTTGAKDVVQGFAGDVTTRGSLSSNTGKLCYQTPYLMFTRPIESRPALLGSTHGFSAGAGGKLSSFNGYVVCSDVKLNGISATDEELTMIENLLKGGVYV